MKNRNNGLTETEEQARQWLARTWGLWEEEIKFNFRSSPDFELPDGTGYEIKLLKTRNGGFIMGWKQWEKLMKHPNCYIVLWEKGAQEPQHVIPVTSLPPRPAKLMVNWFPLECAGHHIAISSQY